MNEQEYFVKLNVIRKRIQECNLDDVEIELEELYCYKPVRLLWFVAKGEYLLMQGIDHAELIGNVRNKIGSIIYDYPGFKEYFDLDCALYERDGTMASPLNKRFAYYMNRINGCDENLVDHEVKEAVQLYIESSENVENINVLKNAYISSNNIVMALILTLEQVRRGYIQENRSDWLYYAHSNFLYIEEKVEEKKENTFVLIADENAASECFILAEILSLGFEHKVFLLLDSVMVEVEEPVQMRETLQTSLDYVENYPEATVIRPVEIICHGKSLGDNREYIIDYICRNETQNDLAVVICSGSMMDELCNRPDMQKRMDRLMPFESECMEDKMYFGWAGSYLSYISDIYRYDVRIDMNKKSTCDFSIVIPARNSSYTLKYTLMTCLEQSYKGSYEIILSDNSTAGNTAVYDLYCELNDEKIKYYKTPRYLSLSKSFEFAYLKASGEFVFSIGSDDGVLPWTLEILAQVLEQYPSEKLIQWERGFYGWPNFNRTQDDEFTIPRKYVKGDYGIHFKEKIEYLAEITRYTQYMYTLPLLYINSGMRRSYIQYLYEKTGRLWDGCNQDIYMGVINASINDRILNLSYPLSIAGMSNSSLGFVTSLPVNDDPERKKIADSAGTGDNIGTYQFSMRERTVPYIPTQIATLYTCLLRAVTRNLLPEQLVIGTLSIKKLYAEVFTSISRLDIMFDYYLHLAKYYADRQGIEFAKWFNETIYIPLINPYYYNETENHNNHIVKNYEEDYDGAKGYGTLDASRYGVSNIKEACELFAKLTFL